MYSEWGANCQKLKSQINKNFKKCSKTDNQIWSLMQKRQTYRFYLQIFYALRNKEKGAIQC